MTALAWTRRALHRDPRVLAFGRLPRRSSPDGSSPALGLVVSVRVGRDAATR